MYKSLLCLIIFLSSCTLVSDNFFAQRDYPIRPSLGYDRPLMFPQYFALTTQSMGVPNIYKELSSRTMWQASSSNFRKAYPNFNINLLVINQGGGVGTFTWEERILLADSLDLLTAAIHSDTFAEEMHRYAQNERPFYVNDTFTVIPTQKIIDEIRNVNLTITIARATLAHGVAAEASVGGLAHTIWFRDDRDYTKEGILLMAIIIGHELTHNMGYKHTSNVPYGVHDPIMKAILALNDNEIQKYIQHTPYFENQFLTRIREQSPKYQLSRDVNTHVEDDSGLEDHIKKMFK